MTEGQIASLWRHPVKGFTPERLARARLTAGGFFPGDRIYAVEDGPTGFDPAAPTWIPKMKFAVLAKIAEVARARTAYDEASGALTVTAAGRAPFCADLTAEPGREAFADWLTGFLGEAANGTLTVVQAPGHRFTDHPQGHLSIVNLASVRELEARVGRPVDPLRFRANLYVEGWPAWIEEQALGATALLGPVRAEVFSPIVRCVATHVDPASGERDMDVVAALREHFGHLHCGVYLHILEGGELAEGDRAELSL
jgi:uncharacterized protein YcbX